MGADLITYIVVGPEKLNITKALRKRVVTRIENVISTVRQAQKDPDFDWGEDPLIGGMGEDLNELGWVEDIAPNTFLNSFVELWNKGDARDTNGRIVKMNGKKMRVVVAGEMTWGDEPSGEGYIMLRDAEKLGLYELLGLH